MRNILKISVALFLTLSLLSGTSHAKDLGKMADEFYAGLADIIERNMNNPERCLAETEDYYQANQKTVRQLRQAAEKAMEQAAPMMEQYMSMSEEELAGLEKQYQDMGQPQISSGGSRYANALGDFAAKYPKYGIRIAAMAMQLVPGF